MPMHISVPVQNSMEYINEIQISPLLSKVEIKVCYVGQEANRNDTVITKELATKFGKNLLGVPIVGYYNEESQDFESHNREVKIENDKYRVIDTTKPYGFVGENAKVWFQKFLDDGVEHEYLMTEGFLWTKIYKESQRVIEKGNNQSMELNEETYKGFWTEDNKTHRNIFIISDGLIEKLCILGENVEPCFEGSQIKSHFSLADNEDFIELKNTLFNMINELKEVCNKGGSQELMNETEKNVQEEIQPETQVREQQKYNLNEIPEYTKLQNDYELLKTQYEQLQNDLNATNETISSLMEFKSQTERKEKEAMIDSFYMLSDKEKKDVKEKIDTYSLRDIEAELSILCVRNRVNFDAPKDENTKNTKNGVITSFNLNNAIMENNGDSDVPEWVQAVQKKQQSN